MELNKTVKRLIVVFCALSMVITSMTLNNVSTANAAEGFNAEFKFERYADVNEEANTATAYVAWKKTDEVNSIVVSDTALGLEEKRLGGGSTWTQFTVQLNKHYTLKIQFFDAAGEEIPVLDGDTIDVCVEHTVIPKEEGYTAIPQKAGSITDTLYYIDDENANAITAEGSWGGIFTPHSACSYHSERVNCILGEDTAALVFKAGNNGNVNSVDVDGTEYQNHSAQFNNDGDCVEIAVEVFKVGVNNVTLNIAGDVDPITFIIKVNKIGYYNVEDYNSQPEGENYPEQAGKIFAGWYTDYSCTTPYMEKTGSAYAKFVDADILGVAAQPGVDGSKIRFISTIDDNLTYNEIGFEISGMHNDVPLKKKDCKSGKALYTGLQENGDAGLVTKTPSQIFGEADSAYIFIFAVTGLSADSTWDVTPYWVTPDGTKVLGTQKQFSQTAKGELSVIS